MNILMINLNGLLSDGLKSLVREVHPHSEFFHALGVETCTKELTTANYDIAIFDLDSVCADQAPAYLKALSIQKQHTPFLVLSNSNSTQLKRLVVAFGARVHLSKSMTARDFLSAFQTSLPMTHHSFAATRLRNRPVSPRSPALHAQITADALTPRQMDVLQELAKGKSNKLIAYDLNVSENTVRNHLSAVFRVLRAKNRTEALCQATRLQIVSTQVDLPAVQPAH